MSATFHIARLGAQGDGIADTESGPLFIPFALPGETVTAARQKDRADLISVIEPSPEIRSATAASSSDCVTSATRSIFPLVSS